MRTAHLRIAVLAALFVCVLSPLANGAPSPSYVRQDQPVFRGAARLHNVLVNSSSSTTPEAFKSIGAIVYDTSTEAPWVYTSGGWTQLLTTLTTSQSFSAITNGTNTTAAMVVGTGASLTVSGSGTINATTLIGSTWAAPAAIGTGTPAAGTFTTGTFSGTVNANGGTLATSAATGNLFNTGATTVNVGGGATTLNLAGGSASTGCTIDGSGNLACTGAIGSGITASPAAASSGNVAYFTGAATVSGENNLHWDSTNDRLGIAAGTSPTDRLDVRYNANGAGGIRVMNADSSVGSYATIYLGNGVSATDVVFGMVGTGNAALGGARSGFIGTNSSTSFVFVTASSEKARITSAGNFGVGDTSPAALFTVGSGDLFQVDSSGRAFLPAGASGAGNLALSTTGDTDTGLYFSAADEMRLQTGGSDRVTLTTTGLGIGDTSPSSLFVVGSGDLFRVDSSGRVLLPAGASGAGNLALSTTGDTNTGLYFSAADEIRVQTGGVDSATINANGLEVNGGVRLNTATAKPACDSSQRGTFWVVQGGAGVKDTVEVCAKDAGDAYSYRTIY